MCGFVEVRRLLRLVLSSSLPVDKHATNSEHARTSSLKPSVGRGPLANKVMMEDLEFNLDTLIARLYTDRSGTSVPARLIEQNARLRQFLNVFYTVEYFFANCLGWLFQVSSFKGERRRVVGNLSMIENGFMSSVTI